MDSSLKGFPITSTMLAVLLAGRLTPIRAENDAAPAGPLVSIALRTGGVLQAELLDFDDHALVVQRDRVLYVFSWRELEPEAAIAVRKARLTADRGDAGLSAQDYFELGLFALILDRNDLAVSEFREATRRNRSFQSKVRDAFADFREKSRGPSLFPLLDESGGDADDANSTEEAQGNPPPGPLGAKLLELPTQSIRDEIRAAYLRFGDKVREVLGPGIRQIETAHFLIWTDWEKPLHDELAQFAETVYEALCRELGVATDQQVFLDKCPVFAFRTKTRFRKFARYFDGYHGESAVGYTRSIQHNGHVHVVLLRMGRSRIDQELFAATFVHESAHAFVHRLHSTRLIPPWVNEGLAELMVERVLRDRSDAREKAGLLARHYRRLGRPMGLSLESSASVEVHQYPLAYGLIDFLYTQNPGGLGDFVRRLKTGESVAASLAGAFPTLNPARLEEAWLESLSSGDPRMFHQP